MGNIKERREQKEIPTPAHPKKYPTLRREESAGKQKDVRNLEGRS